MAADRPVGVDSALYGSFIEYLFKYACGVRIFAEAETITDTRGYFGKILSHYGRIKMGLANSIDLCYCSFAHLRRFPLEEMDQLVKYVRMEEQYYNKLLVEWRGTFPAKVTDTRIFRWQRIVAQPDLVLEKAIVEIKCAIPDMEEWEKQLTKYVALGLLLGMTVKKAILVNFLTGIVYEQVVTMTMLEASRFLTELQ